jgi:penicillin amidase
MKTTSLVPRFVLALCFLLNAFPPPAALAQVATAPAQAGPVAVRLQGLKKAVKVRRDERGIPYIEAEDDSDLYFAQGYVTASDRLWQMDLMRRTARGELSEIFGRATLEEDKRRRTYGFARVSEASVAQADPRSRAVMEAYALGVNAYIDSLDDKSLPLEFQILGYRPRRWTPADSAAVGKNFAEALRPPTPRPSARTSPRRSRRRGSWTSRAPSSPTCRPRRPPPSSPRRRRSTCPSSAQTSRT